MKGQVSVPGPVAESKQDLRSQLAEYVAQQPAAKQSFHKWMQIAELASLAIPIAVFAVALYVSINWKAVPQTAIATAWLCLPASIAPFLILVGVHAIVLRAFPPTGLLGNPLRVAYPLPGGQGVKMQPLRVGRQALGWGWGLVVMALIIGAFWVVFAYAAWTVNLAMLEPLIRILAGVVGVGIAVSITVSILYSLYRSIFRPR
jgi:hypothetical protein